MPRGLISSVTPSDFFGTGATSASAPSGGASGGGVSSGGDSSSAGGPNHEQRTYDGGTPSASPSSTPSPSIQREGEPAHFGDVLESQQLEVSDAEKHVPKIDKVRPAGFYPPGGVDKDGSLGNRPDNYDNDVVRAHERAHAKTHGASEMSPQFSDALKNEISTNVEPYYTAVKTHQVAMSDDPDTKIAEAAPGESDQSLKERATRILDRKLPK